MYAVFVEVVNTDESQIEAARRYLSGVAAPGARQRGATAGYWLAPAEGRGVAVIVYETEEAARAQATTLTVGQRPDWWSASWWTSPHSGIPDNVKVRTIEVREVLASVDGRP